MMEKASTTCQLLQRAAALHAMSASLVIAVFAIVFCCMPTTVILLALAAACHSVGFVVLEVVGSDSCAPFYR